MAGCGENVFQRLCASSLPGRGVLSFRSKHGRHWAVKRRSFITLLGGAAAAWPLTAHAQQTDRVRRIGLLMAWAESDPEAQPRMAAFMSRLRELGWIDGGNCRIERHRSAGDIERMD